MEELEKLRQKYGNDLPDYISAKLTIANIEQEYWERINKEYFK